MLFRKKKPTDKEIEFLIQRSTRLKKVQVDKFSGWADFVIILKDYIEVRLEMKKNLNFNEASEEEIRRIKMYDREIWFINNVILKCVENFVQGLETKIKDIRKEEQRTQESSVV